jgi:hypothetical protein
MYLIGLGKLSGKVSQFKGNHGQLAGLYMPCIEGKLVYPKQDNPNPKPHDNQRQGGRNPLGKVQEPRQEGQGRDPMKDPGSQRVAKQIT